DANIWIAAHKSEIFDVAKQVPLCVLRARAPEVRTDSDEGYGRLARTPALDRQPSDHDEAAPIENFIQHSPKVLAELWKRKVISADGGHFNRPFGQSTSGALDLDNLGFRKHFVPIAAPDKVGTIPGGRMTDFGRQLNHGNFESRISNCEFRVILNSQFEIRN